MRAVFGLCLLTTGLAIGVYSHYPGAQHREASLAELTHIVTGAFPSRAGVQARSSNANAAETGKGQPRKLGAPPPAAGPFQHTGQETGWFANWQSVAAFETWSNRTLSTNGVTTTPSRPQVATSSDAREQHAVTKVAAHQATKPRTPQKPVLRGWRTAVVAVDHTTIAPKRSSSLKPKTAAERWRLTKAIQRELKRVGCYWGKLDGVWGKGSKWAMTDFMRSVNATLPTKNPDYFLLQLVSSHGPNTCGPARTTTQIASRVPQRRDPPVAQSAWVAEVIPTNGARGDDIKATQRVARTRTSVTPQIRTGSLQRQPASKTKQIAAAKRKPAILPGRMSIGALNRDRAPQLVSPPKRARQLDRMIVRAETDTKSHTKAERRLKISAVSPQTQTDASPAARRHPPSSSNSNSDANSQAPVRRVSPSVAERRSTAKAKRARALRKAAAKKKKRRYRRKHRRRSVQSLFMHPLGRR